MWMSLLLACARPGPPTPPLPHTPGALHAVGVSDAADRARDALVAGDRAGARRQLAWLARHAPAPGTVPAPLAPSAAVVQAQAARGAEARELGTIASALSQVALGCGGCHRAAGVGPIFAVERLAPGSDAVSHMARHRWASDSLWEGLVAPDEELWLSGAMAFLEEPLHPEALPDVEARAWTTVLHAVGSYGLEVSDPQGRAALYGEVLHTCAICHAASGVRPPIR